MLMRCAAIRRLLVLITCIALSSTWAVAQQTGVLSGVVRDAQGGVLPGVTISITSPALIGGARPIPTRENRNYQFTGLPPGADGVKDALSGFSALRRADIPGPGPETTRLGGA